MMSENQTTQAYPAETGRSGDFDAIVVGAGFAGLYMLHSLRNLGKPRTLYPYVGGVGTFGTICREAAEKGYEGLVLARHEAPTTAPR